MTYPVKCAIIRHTLLKVNVRMIRDLDHLIEENRDAHPFLPPDYAELHIYESEGFIRGFAGVSGNRLEGIFVTAASRFRGIG